MSAGNESIHTMITYRWFLVSMFSMHRSCVCIRDTFTVFVIFGFCILCFSCSGSVVINYKVVGWKDSCDEVSSEWMRLWLAGKTPLMNLPLASVGGCLHKAQVDKYVFCLSLALDYIPEMTVA